MSGKVTGIIVQRRNPNRVNIQLDGEFAFGLQRLTAAWLSIGQELNDDQINDLQNKDQIEVIHLSAMRLLNYRQRTSVEMTNRLLKKGYEPVQVKVVVDRLLENHLLDDSQFAENWVADRQRLHPRSKRLMSLEMKNKGLDRLTIDAALTQVEDDTHLAELAARSSIRKWSGLAEQEFIKRCATFLGRKGFAGGISYSTARDMWKELQQDLEQ
jgi:regulatory protein